MAKSIKKVKHKTIKEHEPNDIHTLRIRLFIRYTNSEQCKYCTLFKKTKVYKELSENFKKYVPDVESFLYEELDCETYGLKHPRFSDKDVKESNFEKLPYSMDYRTNNYILSLSNITNFPAIEMTIYRWNGTFEKRVIQGVQVMTRKDEDNFEIKFFKYILSYLGGAVPEGLRNRFTHIIAKIDMQKEPLLINEKIFNLTDDTEEN